MNEALGAIFHERVVQSDLAKNQDWKIVHKRDGSGVHFRIRNFTTIVMVKCQDAQQAEVSPENPSSRAQSAPRKAASISPPSIVRKVLSTKYQLHNDVVDDQAQFCSEQKSCLSCHDDDRTDADGDLDGLARDMVQAARRRRSRIVPGQCRPQAMHSPTPPSPRQEIPPAIDRHVQVAMIGPPGGSKTSLITSWVQRQHGGASPASAQPSLQGFNCARQDKVWTVRDRQCGEICCTQVTCYDINGGPAHDFGPQDRKDWRDLLCSMHHVLMVVPCVPDETAQSRAGWNRMLQLAKLWCRWYRHTLKGRARIPALSLVLTFGDALLHQGALQWVQRGQSLQDLSRECKLQHWFLTTAVLDAGRQHDSIDSIDSVMTRIVDECRKTRIGGNSITQTSPFSTKRTPSAPNTPGTWASFTTRESGVVWDD